MFLKGLTVSLVVVLISAVLNYPSLFALSIVGCITCLTGLVGIPRWLVFSFSAWLVFVLLKLISLQSSTAWGEIGPLSGLPLSSILMLFGIWIFPLFLWPLGFLLSFGRWLKK